MNDKTGNYNNIDKFPCRYSAEELKERALQGIQSYRNGNVTLHKDMKKRSLWDDYIKTSPKDVPLTDEDILEAVREVRYGKV